MTLEEHSIFVLPSWVSHFFQNVLPYLLVFAVGKVVLDKVRAREEPDPSDPSFSSRFVRFFFFGPPADIPRTVSAQKVEPANGSQESFAARSAKLIFCTFGLLASFLSWGVLQERIMTSNYDTGKFTSSNFMVFCSRAVGLLISLAVVNLTEQPRLKAPFYKYSFTSLSNVLSSFCQLEALKYLSFPTQVLGKSSKLIPVMIMGIVIQKKSYPAYEYAVALFILAGVALFMISEKSSQVDQENETTLAGLILLVGYLTFDSFTSQWQGFLFSQYQMSSYQMMLGVNTFSATLTLISLFLSGELFPAIYFVMQNPDCFAHVLLFALCGATGSMFIFYTIKTFGPLVFTMIMVTRQLIAIILSCILYGHTIGPGGLCGAAIVFLAIGYRIYAKEAERRGKPHQKR